MAMRTVAQISTKKVWLGDRGVYPVIAIVGSGTAFATFWGISYMSTSVDVHWSRAARATPTHMRNDFAQGKRFRERVERKMVHNSVEELQHVAPPGLQTADRLF